ncbi:MAG: 2,4-dienoyl-CoA reductase, partial [Pseudomonas sp.]
SRAWPLHKAQQPSPSFNGFHRAYLPDVLKEGQ